MTRHRYCNNHKTPSALHSRKVKKKSADINIRFRVSRISSETSLTLLYSLVYVEPYGIVRFLEIKYGVIHEEGLHGSIFLPKSKILVLPPPLPPPPPPRSLQTLSVPSQPGRGGGDFKLVMIQSSQPVWSRRFVAKYV